MENILLLTDFTDVAENARALADNIASKTKAHITALSIVEVPAEVAVSPAGELLGGMADDMRGYRQERKEAEIAMDQWTAALKSDNSAMVVYGNLLENVERIAIEKHIDLIIMSTHGTSGLSEIFTGSVAEKVVLGNQVPVLTMKRNDSKPSFANILVSGDFSSKTPMDVTALKGIQAAFGSTLHLLWVNTKNDFVTTAEAMERMQEFSEVNQLDGVVYHIHNDHDLERGVVNFTSSFDESRVYPIDLIAIEKKNKSPLGYFLTGCQTTSFVNHISKPILTYSEID